MKPRSRRVLRALRILFYGLVLGLAAGEIAVHVFLNVWLPVLLNTRPERVRIQHSGAWMIRPGEIHVVGLGIRNQGPRDQWYLEVDRATLGFDLFALGDHQVRITDADATGAVFRWRARADVEKEGDAAPHRDADPPIPGLDNPPAEPPEDLYATMAHPWRVIVEDAQIDGVRELWLGDQRFDGDARLAGSLVVEPRAWLEARSVVLTIATGRMSLAQTPVLTEVEGEVRLDYAGTDTSESQGKLRVDAISGSVRLDSNTRDLRFLDFYLQRVPWLRLSRGLGTVSLDVHIEDGDFVLGSHVHAAVTDFEANILFYRVTGTADLVIDVDAPDGIVRTRWQLELPDYAVQMVPEAPPHLQGENLVVTADTPEVAIDQPFSSLDVAIDVPEARILDVASYNAYLPDGMGFSLGSGTGTVRAHLLVSTAQGDCSAEAFLEGHAVNLDLDEVAMVGDVLVHGVIPSGNLLSGIYDVSGSRIALSRLQVRSGSSDNPSRDDSDGWWARARVPWGRISEGAPSYLLGTVHLEARDTVPLITLFAERNRVPGWARTLLTAGPVSGSATIAVGTKRVRISGLDLSAGAFTILGELRRDAHTVGKLHVQFGPLAMGLGIQQPDNEIHLFNPRRWYDREPDPDGWSGSPR